MDAKDFPTILAATHYSSELYAAHPLIKKSREGLEQVLRAAAEDPLPRTLFIESFPHFLDPAHYERARGSVLHRFLPGADPYYFAKQWAEKAGWKIVYLDRADLQSVISKIARHAGLTSSKRLQALGDYAHFPLRESYWFEKIMRNAPTARDFILMHPFHVKGFLRESHIKGTKVIWVNHLREFKGFHLGFKPLGASTLARVLLERQLAREKRKPGVAARAHSAIPLVPRRWHKRVKPN